MRDVFDSGPLEHSRREGVTLFGSTMALVAVTAGAFTLGAYLGRDLSPGWGLLFFVVAFALLIGMRFARSSESASVALLLAFGSTLGVATAPTVAYYSSTDPATVWQAAGATALFMAALGTAGYATNRDLRGLSRVALWSLFALIIFGVISIFVQIPQASLAYSVIGLVVFAALVLIDFQRLRRVSDASSAPMMACSIFLDALNVFLFFLNLLNRNRR